MSSRPDDLTTLKDDMIAFIEGHGMRRFHGYIDYEDVQCVMWEANGNPESWKDFVELAKTAESPFVIMHAWTLGKAELESLLESISNAEFTNDEDLEEARWLRSYLGKTGFVQLGFAQQGVMMVCETSTPWYERYQHLLEMVDEFGGIPIEPDQDDET
jgi:hypothetical protein